MEFNIDLIKRSLMIFGFDLSELGIYKIRHVPMHEWRISTFNKPLLYIENLQCCIGLYICGNSFAFATHINTVVFDNNEYILNEDGIPIYLNRCDDLIYEILKFKGTIYEPFKIGISIGSTPLDKNKKSMVLIYEGINNIIKKLNFLNIPVVKLDDIYNPEFIINSLDSNIIVPYKQKNKILK